MTKHISHNTDHKTINQPKKLLRVSCSMLCDQEGQTLIETIVAIVVLTTALASGLALAIYVLSNAGINRNEIIATNLAREGVEVVRYMRDTNWLQGDANDPNGGGQTGLQDCSPDINGNCYPEWLDGPSGSSYHNFDISESANNPNRWALQFDDSSSRWFLQSAGNNYNLYLQSNGIYNHDNNGTPSTYARRIIINYCRAPICDGFPPRHPEVIVQSVVAWRNKKCTWAGTDPTNAPANCKVTIEEHLTNWKDYR